MARSRVTKTLQPGQPGTTRWQHAYGDHLVCVRYREDLQANARYVTVELVLETRPLRRQPPPPVIRATPEQPRLLVQHEVATPEREAMPPDPWQDWTSPVPAPNRTPKAPTATHAPHRSHTERNIQPPRSDTERVYIRIGSDERAVCTIAQHHGAHWDPVAESWHMPLQTVESLGWQTRIKPY